MIFKSGLMHGLINRAIQRFVTDSYSDQQWSATMVRAGFDYSEFEAMWNYERNVTSRVLNAASDVLDRNYDELLEDIGTYLVSHPNVAALRRLLRFSGLDFVDFLHSLDDLSDRAKLAVPDLELPCVEVLEHDAATFSLICRDEEYGWGFVLMGLLRAMADDYGALVYLEHKGKNEGAETVEVLLLEAAFAEGKDFDLGASQI